MIVCIQKTKFSILAIFIISLLLCIRIPSSISTDPTDETLVIGQTDEDNQTATTDESLSHVLSDLNSESTPTPILPTIENDESTENKSEIVDDVISSTVSPIVEDEDPSPTTSTPTKKNLSNINSFEEWKQQQLHAEISKKGDTTNTHSLSSETPLPSSLKGTSSTTNIQQIASSIASSKKGKLRKNFASASCGAKILAHNIEAQNVASILYSSPDEYMLNPCNAKIWFVIELCESIRILNLEIANFELFSSVPKTFRVSASDRYPTKDWHRHHLGTFNASFNRTIQSFQTIEFSTYLKYIKFELLDFHGHEHYCPLSVVRIHGSNVEDEIMTMEENTNINELKSLSDIEDETENEDEDEDLSNEQQVGGIIGSAILDLAKRVFRRQTIRGTQSTTTIPILQTNPLKAECHPKVVNGSIANNSIHLWHQTDEFKQCMAKFLYGLWTKFDTCTVYLSQICFKLNYCCQCSLIQTPRRESTINFYIHSCGYYHMLTSQFICKEEKLIPLNETLLNNNQSVLIEDSSDKILPIDKNETVPVADENTNLSRENLMNNLFNETEFQSQTNLSNEQTSSNTTANDTLLVLEPQSSSNTTDEITHPESDSPDLNSPESITETNNIDESLTTTPSTYNNEVIPPIISSPWLKGMLVNTKSLPELFKIIEKLNFNLTLSNRYLQELSQHYVKKLDETQQTTDLLLKSSKAADEKLANLELHLYKLQDHFNDISYRLIKLEAWIPLIICIIMCLFIWCISSTCRLIHLRRKVKHLLKEFEQMKTIKEKSKDDDDDDELPILSNGSHKRRLSTDSSDSNPTRSQRVPDLILSKIIENGFGKTEQKVNGLTTNTNHT